MKVYEILSHFESIMMYITDDTVSCDWRFIDLSNLMYTYGIITQDKKLVILKQMSIY